MRALVRIIESLGNQGTVDDCFARLGRDRKHGAEAERYLPAGEALVAPIAKFGGDAWTPTDAGAGLASHLHPAEVMIKAAEQAAGDAQPWWSVDAVQHDRRGRGLAHEVIARQAPLGDLSTAYLTGPATMVEPTLQVRTAAGLAPVQIRDDLAALTASVTCPAFDLAVLRWLPPITQATPKRLVAHADNDLPGSTGAGFVWSLAISQGFCVSCCGVRPRSRSTRVPADAVTSGPVPCRHLDAPAVPAHGRAPRPQKGKTARRSPQPRLPG